jgi:hypothetical protein
MKFHAHGTDELGNPTRFVYCKVCATTRDNGCAKCKQFYCLQCDTNRPAYFMQEVSHSLLRTAEQRCAYCVTKDAVDAYRNRLVAVHAVQRRTGLMVVNVFLTVTMVVAIPFMFMSEHGYFSGKLLLLALGAITVYFISWPDLKRNYELRKGAQRVIREVDERADRQTATLPVWVRALKHEEEQRKEIREGQALKYG